MSTKQYSIDVANLGLHKTDSAVRFGSYPLSIDEYSNIENVKNQSRILNNGFEDYNINLVNNSINVSFDSMTQDSVLLSSIGKSSSLISDNTIFLDQEKFQSMTQVPLYGCASRGYGHSTKMLIFKRQNDKIGIEKSFEFKNYNSIDNFDNDSFTEINIDDKYYCVTGLTKPISFCNLNGSSREFSEIDYLNANFDYTRLITPQLEDWQFFDLCEYIPVDKLKIRTTDRLLNSILLHTKFFPIFKHFAIIAEFENGLLQVFQNDIESIDYRLGSILLNKQATDNSLGNITGIYIFYAAMPMCFSGDNIETLNIRDLVLNDDDIIKIGIDNNSYDHNIFISEPYITLNKEPNQTYWATNIDIPSRFKRCFLEVDKPIIVNNTLVDSGTRYYFNNNDKNSFVISPPTKLYSLLNEITIVDNRYVYLDEIQNSDALAIYGQFQDGNTVRYSLMAISRPFGLNEDTRNASVTGYGEGPYSYGGYGNGFMPGSGTNIIYSPLSVPVENFISLDMMAVDINPSVDGFQYILPGWTKKQDVSIINIVDGSTFINWKFIEPDILVIDSKYVDSSATYRIVFKPILNPIIETIDIASKSLTMTIDENPLTTYNSIKKILALASTNISIKVGYIDEDMSPVYFNNSITALIHITPNFLHKSITGFKTILYWE